MAPPAARITDMHTCPMVTPGVPPVPHVGGPVTMGSPNVLVAGMPQARVGDMCTCVGPPDAIAMGSMTVLVNGIPAARMGDPTVHGGLIVSGAPNVLIGVAGAGGAGGGGPGGPGSPAGPRAPGALPTPQTAPPPAAQGPADPQVWRMGGDDNVDVMFAEAGGRAGRIPGGVAAEGEVGFGMARMDHSGHMAGPLGGAHRLEVGTASAQGYGGITNRGAGAEASAGAQMVRQEGSLFVGPDANNPFGEAGGGYSLMSAEAKAGGLVGSDGRRAGLAVAVGAEASALSGDATGEINIPIPFTGWSFSVRGGVSGDVGAVGGSFEAHAIKDLQTGRYHLGAAPGGAFGIGGGLNLDFSVGPRYTTRDR